MHHALIGLNIYNNPVYSGFIRHETLISADGRCFMRADVAATVLPCMDQGFAPFFMRLFTGFGETACVFMIRKPLKSQHKRGQEQSNKNSRL